MKACTSATGLSMHSDACQVLTIEPSVCDFKGASLRWERQRNNSQHSKCVLIHISSATASLLRAHAAVLCIVRRASTIQPLSRAFPPRGGGGGGEGIYVHMCVRACVFKLYTRQDRGPWHRGSQGPLRPMLQLWTLQMNALQGLPDQGRGHP